MNGKLPVTGTMQKYWQPILQQLQVYMPVLHPFNFGIIFATLNLFKILRDMMHDKMVKINKKVATEYLKIFYPTIRTEITQLSTGNNFAGIMQAIINHMKLLLKESGVSIISYHMKSMEWLYRNGNSYIKDMIENLFIRSFESLKKLCEHQQWETLYQYIPVKFQEIHLEQIRQDELIINKG